MRFQNYFIADSIDVDGYANVFDVQAVIPIPKMGFLPRAIFRPTLPVVTTPDGDTGLGDLAWLYIFAFDHDWGTLGVGPAGAFPTATNDKFGANVWTLGPAVVGIFKNIPNVQYGGLIFNTWSVGDTGGRDSVNALSFQPILNYHFGKGWYTGMGDPAFEVNWNNSDKPMYAPLSLRLGKVVSVHKQKIDLNAQIIYNVGDEIEGRDQWGFKLTANFLFPGM